MANYTPATPEQLDELKTMAREYERLAGRQGYLQTGTSETGRERYVFGDLTTAYGIDMALKHQRRLLSAVLDCEHRDIARFRFLRNYCRSCGAMGEALADAR